MLHKLDQLAELAESQALRDLIAQAITRILSGKTVSKTVYHFIEWTVNKELTNV